jgi:thiol-disulfide isomerase/thioredoxin
MRTSLVGCAVLALLACFAVAETRDAVTPDAADAMMAEIVAKAYARAKSGEEVDFDTTQAELVAHLKKHPTTRFAPFHLHEFVRLKEANHPGSSESLWRHFEALPVPEVKEFARGKLRIYELKHTPLQLAFTAADGRRIDLEDLRGKVVLIDFWATWCAPCVAELPHLQELQRRFGPAGFEIIGMALESRGTRATATAEERERKKKAELERMLGFVRDRGITWPQFCDGLGFESPVVKKFSINEIPMLLLLGRDGRLVGANLRGEALERELERLLKS